MTAASASPGSGPGPVVLVAEDEESVRLMLSVALRREGFDALLCVDGQDALDRLTSGGEVDAVLTDVRMPRLDGVGFVSQLRSDPRWRTVPVVAMSAYNDEQQEQEIRAAGADAFLPKPFTIESLAGVLNSLLPRRGASPA